jgi:patatin-like phospholipase/acyl hydrolase
VGKYRIITFDGGGVRGALSINLLKRLLYRFPDLVAATDLFAGTSTGSFIALGLAFGLSVDVMVDLYGVDNAEFIFLHKGCGLIRPKYQNVRLSLILRSIFPPELRLSDLSRRVLIPSFRLTGCRSGNWGPTFYHNYPNSGTLDEYVVDAALASSAAPIYFPSHNNHIDGGVIANNPSIAAISFAIDPQSGKRNLDEITLLSLGTGNNPQQLKVRTSGWGAVQWVLYPRPFLPILTLLLDGAVEADEQLSARLLRERYYRLNPDLTFPVALDEYKRIPELVRISCEYDLEPVCEWITRNWY